MQSLVDRFCPNVHDAPITAAAYDPETGTVATADANGVVAVQRRGEASPQLVFQPGGRINGALALIRGGSLLAVGDDDGTIGVYRTDNGEPTFCEEREGARGRVRAMRGVALSPEGSRLAAIAIDGLLRVWDLTQEDRNAWRGFSGDTVQFDPRGERLLAMDEDGQPRLMDLSTLQALFMDKLQTPADRARFTADGTMVIAAGQAGVSLLRVADGAMVASFATQGGSGIANLLQSPDATRAAAITQRSVHVFSLPELEHVDSFKHGAPNPSGAAIWDTGGLRVGGSDGLMHGGGSGSLGPTTAGGGFGAHRIAAHGRVVTLWNGDERKSVFKLDCTPAQSFIDRDGRFLVSLPDKGPIQVHACASGKAMFDGGPQTSGAVDAAVGGDVIAIQLAKKGVRWWHLGENRGFELDWPEAMALTGGGTWLAVVTPKGAIRILDPATGKDAMADPIPLAGVGIQQLCFANRQPALLILDAAGVLGHYDLTAAAQGGPAATGRDVITINVPVDRIWGVTGGQLCALRLPNEEGGCTILWVDVHACEVVHEATSLSRHAWVDAEHGRIIEPARSGALVEYDPDGKETRVLRSLPDGEWISFGWNGILATSKGAAGAI